MKITPLDIRQKTFNKKTLGGIDREEVAAFLNSLSMAWEKVLDENKELRIRLEHAENEVKKLREVESALHRTLKTAEETGTQMVEQARQEANLMVKEAQLKAENTERESKWRSKAIIDEAETEAKKIYKNLQQEVKNLENEYRTLDHLHENLVLELKNLSGDILEKLDKIEVKKNKVIFIAPQPKPAIQGNLFDEVPESLTAKKSHDFFPEQAKPEEVAEAQPTVKEPVEEETSVEEEIVLPAVESVVEVVEESQAIEEPIAEEIYAAISESETLQETVEEEPVAEVQEPEIGAEPTFTWQEEQQEDEAEQPDEIPSEPLFFNPQSEEPIQMPIIEPVDDSKKAAKKSGGSFFDDLDD